MRLMNKIFPVLLLAFCLLFTISCNKKTDQNVIAKAFGKELSLKEAEPFISQYIDSKDSLLKLSNYVNLWLSQQIKLNNAKRNLVDNDPEIEKKVADYRNDLLIYYYEQNIISEQLDTLVKEEEMLSFFEQNKENFQLSTNIVRMLFVKVEEDSKILNKFRTLIKNPVGKNKSKLEELSSKFAENSFLEDQTWLNFDDIIKEVPLRTYNVEQFLENNKYVEIKEGAYIYLVHILAYQIKNASSNFELEKDNIKKVIIQKRRKDLLKKLETDLKKEAEIKKEIESFVK